MHIVSGACTSCSAVDNCQSCITNYWGKICQHTCNHCSSYSQTDGCLVSGCSPGYYRSYSNDKGGYTCDECRSTCTSCTTYNYCQSCSQKHWGTTCQTDCPRTCSVCTANTTCPSCEIGYWGSTCQHSCSVCLANICSKSQGCTSGCINGYYLENSENENHCKQCLSACTTCSDNVTFSSCPSGFVGLQCEYDCRACNGGLCDTHSGVCTYSCGDDEYFEIDRRGT